MSDELKRVPLDARHRELGAKMVPFAGFHMPLQYTGIKEEHLAVRNGVGLFDVSHMGEVEFRGADAVKAVNRLVTNDLEPIAIGQAMYTAMCHEDGGIVDDLIVYKLAEDHVLACVNAANRDKDFGHMQAHLIDGEVTMEDTGDQWAQLALQGPKAPAMLATLTEMDLDSIATYHCAWGEVAGERCLVARTGYTGEDGFELYIPAESAGAVFDAIVAAGADWDLAMAGLGCRDTLRLESKYLLYGNDMNDATNPVEAGLNWVVKLGREPSFVGEEAIAAIKEAGPKRRLRGFVLEGRGVLRPGFTVIVDGEPVGELTSGSYGPTLEKSIGLGYVDVEAADATDVEIEVRGKRVAATMTKKPFYSRPKS